NAQPTETKLSRQAHTCKNKKLRRDQKQAEMLHELDVDIPLLIDDIVFDPSRHRIQSATQKISANDNIYYLEREELLIETLIREAKSSDSNSFELPEILSNFFSLIYTDIIRETDVGIEGSSSNTTNKRLWKKLWYTHNIQSDRDFQDLFDTATAFNTRREKAGLIISACHNSQSISELVQFKHIAEPEYITDLSGQTLVYLEQLDDYNAIILATNAVNNYYFHTLEHPSHRNDEFWTNFIKYFRAYIRNNLLPFISSNTASTHNIDHHECVNKLLQGLKALSNCVNRFLQDYYEDLYMKLSGLSWGPFAPKLLDLCVLVALEDYEEEELCFLQLQIVIYLRLRQIIAFASCLLLHAYIKARIKKGANRPMVSEQDLNNAQGLNHWTHLPKLKAKQIQVPSAISDRRRGYIGLKAEDPLPDL
ncbi:26886_t:CDS:2, partial [Racocetra persica]